MRCEWFAMCDHEAVRRMKHIAFPGGVPICQRCFNWYERMRDS